MAQDDTTDIPQIYLITPPHFDPHSFPETLGRVLDAHPVACVRVSSGGWDEAGLRQAVDVVRDSAHARDVVTLVEDHFRLVAHHGLDGVHLSDGRNVRATSKEMDGDAIIGTYCGASRHDGMAAGEAGAAYIAFGPTTPSALGNGAVADSDLFTWWSEMIELPVVAEGNLTAETVATLAPHTDFLAFGTEIWSADDPVGELARLTAALG